MRGLVWLIFRSRKSPFQSDVLRDVQRWAAGEDKVRVRVLRTEERRMAQQGGGRRPIDVLKPVDAHELYQASHREPSCVLGQGSLYVLKDPRRDPPTERDCISLVDYLCHKANYRVLHSEQSAAEAAALMLSSSPLPDCSGLRDPRLLPIHVFDAAVQSTTLRNPASRERFRQRYQTTRGGWDSPSAGLWSQADAHARHGAAGPDRVPLYVGGYEVPLGFHWDAAAGRKVTTVANSCAVWKVDPSGYVNVYPDAHIRSGSRGVRKVWTAER